MNNKARTSIFVLVFLLITPLLISPNHPLFADNQTRMVVSTLTPHDLEWEVGKYAYSESEGLSLVTTDGIISNIDPDIYIAENGNTGDSGVRVGALTEIPVSNGYVNFSCDVRARASESFAVSLGIKLYDPHTKVLVESTQSGFYQPGPLDTGWVHRDKQIYVGDYNTILMLIYYLDSWVAVYNQEIFVKNLEVYYLEQVPYDQNGLQTLIPDDFTWHAGVFSLSDNVLTLSASKDFDYSVSPNIHITEREDSSYTGFKGVYAEIPLSNGYLNFTCVTRAKGSSSTYVSLGAKVFNAENFSKIPSIEGLQIGVYQPETSDTGYVAHEKSVYIGDYESVIIFFYFLDSWEAYHEQEVWIGNLRIYNSGANTGLIDIPFLSILFSLSMISLTIVLMRKLNP